MLQLEGAVEVVDDGALAATGDHDHLLDAARDRFLDAVLDGGLVHQWQHLFWHRLGGRQKASAQTGRGDDCLADGRYRHPGQSKAWRPQTGSELGSRDGWSGWWGAPSSPSTSGAKASSRRRP